MKITKWIIFFPVAIWIAGLVRANVILPLFIRHLPEALFVSMLIEFIVLWLVLAKLFRVQSAVWRIVLAVIIANATTTVIGMMLPLTPQLSHIAEAFFISVIVEWFIFILVFEKTKISFKQLFISSLLCNLVSYSFITPYLLYLF